jgi:hypothetical protein
VELNLLKSHLKNTSLPEGIKVKKYFAAEKLSESIKSYQKVSNCQFSYLSGWSKLLLFERAKKIVYVVE